jgi:hypothetical protein
MLLTPVAFVLIGFVACVGVLTGTYLVQQSVARIGRRE